jgi:hypothetical protein
MSEEVRREVSLFGAIRYYNKEGNLHRTDGPAVTYTSGREEWYQNGEFHREGGPAVAYADGSKEWWIEGNLHRLDGPAVECTDGYKAWYIEGKQYMTEKEWEKARCPSIEEAAAMFKEVQHE